MLTSISSRACEISSSSVYRATGVRGRTMTPVQSAFLRALLLFSLSHSPTIERIDVPDRAASKMPNGLMSDKNASTLLLLAVNSTIQLFSATSTTFPLNPSAKVFIADKCKFLAMSASEAVMPGCLLGYKGDDDPPWPPEADLESPPAASNDRAMACSRADLSVFWVEVCSPSVEVRGWTPSRGF